MAARSHRMRRAFSVLLLLGAPLAGSEFQWRQYAADAGASKYAPLDQIDRDNVHRLEIAWRWVTPDDGVAERFRGYRPGIFETTPVQVGDRLMVATGLGLAAAIDPASGELLWLYDPYTDEQGPDRATLGMAVSRGGTAWSDGERERLFFTTQGHLVSLDARTGRPDAGFGEGGRIDLRLGVEERPLRQYFWTSPPLVCGDTVVVGNSTLDFATRQRAPAGHLRGYDLRTGERKWLFWLVPREGEFGHETWEEGSAEYTGSANVWSWLSCDAVRGLVYAPTTTPNNDWYGGHRPGDGLFAESVLCLDAETGERVWHFQAVHHGLWDYDFPAPPILADLTVDGREIPALVQLSKQAFAYVFDRTTGEPVWPIVELPVPPSRVPGERALRTQPIPSWPLPYDLHGLSHDDLIDFTPELRAQALEVVREYEIGPIFLPPIVAGDLGRKGILQTPGAVGGTNWNGGALDPETNVLYVPSITAPSPVAVAEPDPARSDLRYTITFVAPQVALPNGLPITKPPWGRITAIDLDTGEHLWVAANGDGPVDHPALAGLDLPPLGQRGRASPLVTRTLLFVPEGSKDMIGVPTGDGGRGFRAFDKATGEVVWEMELPYGATGAPMSYLHDGRQYIVLPVGEAGSPGELVALALPESP